MLTNTPYKLTATNQLLDILPLLNQFHLVKTRPNHDPRQRPVQDHAESWVFFSRYFFGLFALDGRRCSCKWARQTCLMRVPGLQLQACLGVHLFAWLCWLAPLVGLSLLSPTSLLCLWMWTWPALELGAPGISFNI